MQTTLHTCITSVRPIPLYLVNIRLTNFPRPKSLKTEELELFNFFHKWLCLRFVNDNLQLLYARKLSERTIPARKRRKRSKRQTSYAIFIVLYVWPQGPFAKTILYIWKTWFLKVWFCLSALNQVASLVTDIKSASYTNMPATLSRVPANQPTQRPPTLPTRPPMMKPQQPRPAGWCCMRVVSSSWSGVHVYSSRIILVLVYGTYRFSFFS